MDCDNKEVELDLTLKGRGEFGRSSRRRKPEFSPRLMTRRVKEAILAREISLCWDVVCVEQMRKILS